MSEQTIIERANASLGAGEFERAAELYMSWLDAHPDDPDGLHGLGIIAWMGGRLDEARQHVRRAAEVAPGEGIYLCTLGDIERMSGNLAAAEDCLCRALAMRPEHGQAYNNLGMVYLDQGRLVEAATVLMAAVRVDPGLAMAHYNLGIIYKELNHLEEAIASYRQAISLNRDFVEAHVNLAVALLLDGQLEEGFDEYEWRRRPPFASEPPPSAPEWDGLVDPNGVLVLRAEQGFGDVIQFARYIPFIAQEGMRVILQCPPELESLMLSVSGVASTYRPDEALPPHTAQLPLLSLPRLFETRVDRIPQNVPYLSAPFAKVSRWREQLYDLGETIKVGLRWAGNPANTHDRRRSVPLALFEGLAGLPQVTFISLDNAPVRDEEAHAAEKLGLIDFSAQLDDFTDTAALIVNLDLVIAVDTAVLHLAGALGRPAWALLRYSPHWPWLLGRDDSPWYPGVRLFRQESAGEWAAVVSRVEVALRAAMAEATRGGG